MRISGASGIYFILTSVQFGVHHFSFKTKNNKCQSFFNSPGRHPCLWCTILALEMHLAYDKRSRVQESTLQHHKKTFEKFQTQANGDIKKAKDYFNVLHEPLLGIPTDQLKKILKISYTYNRFIL